MKIQNKWNLLWVLLAVMVLGTGTTAYAAEEPAAEGTIAVGVHIEDMDLSGMTVSEATALVQNYMDELKELELTIDYAGVEEVVALKDLGFQWTNPQVIEEAAVYGNVGNVLERYQETTDLKQEKVTLEIQYTWKNSILLNKVRASAEARETAPVEATIVRDNKKKEFVITESATGISIDVAETMNTINALLENGWKDANLSVQAASVVLQPKFSTEMANEIQDMLGEYETVYNAAEIDRSENLRVACNYINGVVLMPGESLSFFDYLYPVTTERGYRYGIAYQGGRYIESLGGGLCQVSTTCYNAVLKAELEVLERTQHSMTVSYVDPGLDSGQAWSSGRNLNFANNTDHPVYVEAHLYTNQHGTSFVYIGLWGKETRPENRTVKYISEFSEEFPYEGQPEITLNPSMGYLDWDMVQDQYPKVYAMAYKLVYVDGKLESKTPLYEKADYYRPTPQRWEVGTGGMSAEEFYASLPEGTVLWPPIP